MLGTRMVRVNRRSGLCVSEVPCSSSRSQTDLYDSVWIITIAVHTYFAIIKGYKLSYPRFCVTIFLLWTFVYTMAIAGVALHPHDYYVRAGAWVRGMAPPFTSVI